MGRRTITALAILCAAVVSSLPVSAQGNCPYPLSHAFGSYFVCPDRDSVGAFAYLLGDPEDVNTGSANILCLVPDGARCVSEGSGVADDDRMTIEASWDAPGSLGCPVASGVAGRIAIVTACGHRFGGESLLVSLSGSHELVGYLVEPAHPYDPATDTITPLQATTSVIVHETRPGAITLDFLPIAPHTDCDPGTLGDNLGICAVPYVPTIATGPVYTLVLPCDAQADLRRAVWTATGVTPDAAGRATVFVEAPPVGECRLVGATLVIDGVESSAIASYVAGADCVNRDGDPSWTCRRDCDSITCLPDCDDNDPNRYPGGPHECPGPICYDPEYPGYVDTDGDYVGDRCDNCPTVPNTSQNDADADGFGDACDNCPSVANPGQENVDGDQFGDVCDPCPGDPGTGPDRDGDAIPDVCDNCPDTSNHNQSDVDGDGPGDVCDYCPSVPEPYQRDSDYDSYGDLCDNCPFTPNYNQVDCDGDGIGDVCDICDIPPPGDPDPCSCRVQEVVGIVVDNGAGAGKGSGLLRWHANAERDVVAYNVVTFNSQGDFVPVNPAPIPCVECTSGLGADYAFIVPKHKSGRDFFIAMVHANGLASIFGPSSRH